MKLGTKRIKNTLFNVVLGSFLICSTVVSAGSGSVAALTGSDFNPGHIIDDSVFTNNTSMSVAQIQNFLNSKMPSCDTNGTTTMSYYYNSSTGEVNTNGSWITTSRTVYGQHYADFWNNHTSDSAGRTRSSTYMINESVAPYVCLPNYVENPATLSNNLRNPSTSVSGGQSAAQIIYNVAQTYNINPQVLTVTLQKEEGLVTDDWPWMNEYETAMGYGCPDTAPCDTQYYGFYNQVANAAMQFRHYLTNPNSFNYIPGNNYVYYNPVASCGGTTINIQNRATAALYDYTPYQPNPAALTGVSNSSAGGGDNCSAFGNRNFWWYFNQWFGSTISYSPPTCNSKVSNATCMWQLYNESNDNDFLTIDNAERDAAVANSGYSYDTMPFYAFTSQQVGTIPVYRINMSGEHFYTSSTAERDSLLQNSQNTYEGITFYMYPGSTDTNASYPVYRMNGSSGHVFVATVREKNYLISQGYSYEGVAFNAPSGLTAAPDPVQSRVNVYRLNNSALGHFYTVDISERDALLSSGWTYEGVMMQTPAASTSNPVYRLVNNSTHMFTASATERDQLISGGWTYEGVAWYVDSSTPQVYRFYMNGGHFYTTDLNEAFSISNRGAQYESVAFGYNQAPNLPTYRLYNGAYHFFTASVDEALTIANTGWKYEGIAWYDSSTTTSSPTYRLVNESQHFYTSSDTEKSQLVASGWKYEGIAWYGF